MQSLQLANRKKSKQNSTNLAKQLKSNFITLLFTS